MEALNKSLLQSSIPSGARDRFDSVGFMRGLPPASLRIECFRSR
jgi:hypothetical protein